MLINLRPHHALCIQTYVGKGYNQDFVSNMDAVVELLSTHNPHVKLVSVCDLICQHCPHKIGSVCELEQKILYFDGKVLELTGLSFDSVIFWRELVSIIKNVILTNHDYAETCPDCSWSDLCNSIKASLENTSTL